MDLETFNEQISCKLNSRERELRSAELAQKIQELKAAEVQKKSASQKLKTRIDDLNRDIQRLALEVHEGEELRPIACTQHLDFSTGTVEIRRADTGEVHRVRAMLPEERQAAMPFENVSPVTKGRSKKQKAADSDDGQDEFEAGLQ
jgi:hypothetical protein